MNAEEYREYQKTVQEFFEEEGIHSLNRKTLNYEQAEITGEDWEDAEPYFSNASCDCCGIYLAGDRVAADSWNAEKEQIQEYIICLDCEYYAKYGQLDDMTMLDIEKSE